MTFPINPRATDMHEPHVEDVWSFANRIAEEMEEDQRDNTEAAYMVGFYDMREDER